MKQYLAKLVGKSPDNLPHQIGEYWIKAQGLDEAMILANKHRTKYTSHVFLFKLENQYQVKPLRKKKKRVEPLHRDTLTYAERLKLRKPPSHNK